MWTLGVVAITTLLAYLLALILNQRFRGKSLFRTIVILPAATSLALIGDGLQVRIRAERPVNHTLAGFGPTEGGIPWLANVPQAMVGDHLRGHPGVGAADRR